MLLPVALGGEQLKELRCYFSRVQMARYKAMEVHTRAPIRAEHSFI
jgi:hypothetical protein